MARADYKAAKKLGDDAVKAAVKSGVSPYLPVLDEIKDTAGEQRLGLMELPLSRITGNKEVGRNSAFACNFMPIMEEGTEFASKWGNLYDSYAVEGIRDAIRAYEYMNKYYVLEGNKRVSVSKYGGSDFILADVTRILPRRNDTKEVEVYYEYLDFYRVTKNYHIVFSEPGMYRKLAELLGEDLEHVWDKELCSDLKSAYFSFSKKCRSAFKLAGDTEMSDAFLVYISIFPMKTLYQESEEQIVRRLKMLRSELFISGDVKDIAFFDETPDGDARKGGIMSLFSSGKRYTEASPLRVGFVYGEDIESSRWTDSHEAGRLYVNAMTEHNVVTASYTANDGNVEAAIRQALDDKNEIIFTVSPDMMSDTLKLAVGNKDVRFLNCSLAQTSSAVRAYHGKLYEAAFLAGVLTADTQLREGAGQRRIGYILRGSSAMALADLNAFAIGVSMIDPECRIVLGRSEDCREEWRQQGIGCYADLDYAAAAVSGEKPGVYRLTDDDEEFICAPYFLWGRYYVQIVQSVLSGAYELTQLSRSNTAANYWFGLSAGVVDLRVSQVSFRTKKLLSFFKTALVNGGFDPFSGEIHSQEGIVQAATKVKGSGISAQQERLKPGSIATMNWLNDNIDGEIPE